MNWNNKKILIVGMDGFLGSHLAESLLLEGAHVRIFTPLDLNEHSNIGHHLSDHPNLEILHAPTSVFLPDHGVYDAIEGCEIVYHLGMLDLNMHGARRKIHDLEKANVDFMNVLNLFLACREVGVSRVIHVSRRFELKETVRDVIPDEYPEIGNINYEKSKYSIDDLAGNFFNTYGLPVVVVHVHNLFGPGQRTDEIIPSIVDQVLNKNSSILTKNADSSYEFIYVSDVVKGLLLAGSVRDVEGKTFELGTGQEVWVSDIAQKIALKLDHPIKSVVNQKKSLKTAAKYDHSKLEVNSARKLLRWEPQVDMDEGLDRVIDWMRSQRG